MYDWRGWLSRPRRFIPCLLGMMFVSLLVSCYPLQERLTRAPAPQVHFEELAHLRCAHAHFSLHQWQAEQADRLYPPKYRSTWMIPQEGTERAVAVLVHGLNLKPTKMNAIAHVLTAAGVRVLRVTLQGHGCLDIHDFQAVSTAAWFYDLLRAYCLASHYAREHLLPLYYVGYSAGGGLLVDLMQRKWAETLRFDKMILFAPAIALSNLGVILSRMAWSFTTRQPLARWTSSLLIPSTTPEAYLCYIGTTLAAYTAQLHSIKNLAAEGLTGLDTIPTLIFTDPQDELVSQTGIWTMVQQAALKHWQISEIHKTQAPHHLIIDEESVGKEQWKKIVKNIQYHLFPREHGDAGD
jgi:esterase/lipase